MKKYIAILFLSVFIVSCTKFKNLAQKYPDDNYIEEMVERIIEKKLEAMGGLSKDSMTGKIDLSFWSPEEKALQECYAKCDSQSNH